jgi:hypothetical protein
MTTDLIAEVGIDEQGRLYLRPCSASFPYIYREAVEVHWDPDRRHLYSPRPREWTYPQWFRHIVEAAALQSCDLRLTPATAWTNVPPDVRAEMELANQSLWH